MNQDLRYPLSWPLGTKRTPAGQRRLARFGARALQANSTTIAGQLSLLDRELFLLGVPSSDWLVSSNLRVRKDGLPYSQQARPEDPGIAVYFNLDGKAHCLACDRWTLPEHNLRAIVLHIAALRGQERWGVGTLEQAFAGYAALPAPGARPMRHWSEVFAVPHDRFDADVARGAKARYRELVKLHHPDAGGDRAAFEEVQAAWEQFQAEHGGVPA